MVVAVRLGMPDGQPWRLDGLSVNSMGSRPSAAEQPAGLGPKPFPQRLCLSAARNKPGHCGAKAACLLWGEKDADKCVRRPSAGSAKGVEFPLQTVIWQPTGRRQRNAARVHASDHTPVFSGDLFCATESVPAQDPWRPIGA